ncbi:DUF2182 domain-containing protein [Rhodobacteraceae bacterium CCMM004]|nr:DUF2182 domain-containing protein [Rhodobacteraceae bacterium CCMM004]
MTHSPTRRPWRGVAWLAFFAVVLAAWLWLFAMARMAGVDVLGRPVGMGMMDMTRWAPLAGMWAVMMAAMMGPTLVPTLAAYDDLIAAADGSRAGWWGVVAGYFAVWLGVALALAAIQVALWQSGAVDRLGVATSAWLSGGLLVAVGVYQFTHAKAVCHGVCHAPMHYFLGRWRRGAWGGARMGAALGAYCAGCCWGFMALGFVGGTMSLAWMGLATLAMVLEKLPQLGHHVTRPLGAALVVAGLAVLAAAAV